jgi:outer membrane immunogenic protein
VPVSTVGGEIASYNLSSTVIGGATAGYNYQIPGSAIVFGLETEFGALRLTGSSSFSSVSPLPFASNLTASTTIGNWYNATTLRLGWAWDYVLFYGKGGFAVSTIESTIADNRGLGPGTGKKDIFGWAFGGSVEYVLAPRWSVKAEYLWLGLNHSLQVCAGVAPGFVGGGGTFCSTTNTQAVQTFKGQLSARRWAGLRPILRCRRTKFVGNAERALFGKNRNTLVVADARLHRHDGWRRE